MLVQKRSAAAREAVPLTGLKTDLGCLTANSHKIDWLLLMYVVNQRAAQFALVLVKALGKPLGWHEPIRKAALFHDIGKLWIPDEILEKPGPLSEEEYEKVKEHTVLGASVLSTTTSGPMRMAGRVARSHHERWDGNGYPDGLQGEEIPLSARIVAVADAFDAMTRDRPYRGALPIERAFEVIQEEAGAWFDPKISEAAVRSRDAMATHV